MDMLTSKYNQSENNCLDCALYLKENADLKEAFLDADYESVCRSMQYEDELSYAYRLLEDYKAEIEQLKAELSSGRQRKKNVLEVVRQPDSNTLRAPNSLTVTNKKYDSKYRVVEDKDKPFHGDSKRSHRA